MKLKKEFLLILIQFFVWFSLFFIIFFIFFNYNSFKNYFYNEDDFFLNDDNYYSAYEKQKIDKEVDIILQKRQIEKLKQQLKTNELIQKNTSLVRLTYIDFDDKNSSYIIKWYKDFFELFLNHKVFSDKILDLNIDLYKSKGDVRWKLYWKKIKLYEIFSRDKSEVFSVFIHEFWHFIDLYYFPKNIIRDISDDFYKISWDDKKLLSWQKTNDFVTGYSMSNKYEDFAESFLFYILFNNEFLEKSKDSDILKKKYDFFTNYVFTKWEFINTSFSLNNNFSQYIRDSTKLSYNLENLLKYLKK